MSINSYFDKSYDSPEVPSLDDDISPLSSKSSPDSPEDDLLAVHEKRKHFDDNESSNRLKKQQPGKKVGRKPDLSEPETKRKAQNRAAQRAFRERKERHLKELEERVNSLEQEQQVTTSENDSLRAQVKALQSELASYKSDRSVPSLGSSKSSDSVSPLSQAKQPFTFEYPFFPTQGAEDSNNNAASSKSSSVSEPVPGLLESSPASSNSLSTGTSPAFTDDTFSASGKKEHFCDNLSLACGTCDNPRRQSGDKVQAPTYTAKSDNPGDLDRILGFSVGNYVNHSNTGSLLTKKQQILHPLGVGVTDFDSYRDPILDDAGGFILPDITTEDSIFDPFANQVDFENILFNPDQLSPDSIASVGSTLGLGASGQTPGVDDSATESFLESVPSDGSDKLINCRDVWDRITTHPKFGDLDIEGLCAELKTKAKCSERGVLVNQDDVDRVLSAL